MARIRTIKPEFFMDDELAELSPLHRLLFIGLWTLADREGRLEDRPKRIKAQVLPFDDGDVDAMLADLDVGGFLERYEADGKRYIAIKSFTRHQRITGSEADSVSQIPPPDRQGNTEETPKDHEGNTKETPRTTGKERKGKEGNGEVGEGVQGKGGEPSADDAPSETAAQLPRASRSADSRGSRLPDGWLLPKPWGDWALTEKPGWTAEHVRQCADRFADHWHGKAGKDARKADWQATWRNWVRNEHGGGARASPRPTVAEQSQAAIAAWFGADSGQNVIDGQAELVNA